MGWVLLVLAGLVEIAWSQSIRPARSRSGVLVSKDPFTIGRVAAVGVIIGGVVLARLTS